MLSYFPLVQSFNLSFITCTYSLILNAISSFEITISVYVVKLKVTVMEYSLLFWKSFTYAVHPILGRLILHGLFHKTCTSVLKKASANAMII